MSLNKVKSIDKVSMLKFDFRKPRDSIIPIKCSVHGLSVSYVLHRLAVNRVVHQLKKAGKELVSVCFCFGSKPIVVVNIRSKPS